MPPSAKEHGSTGGIDSIPLPEVIHIGAMDAMEVDAEHHHHHHHHHHDLLRTPPTNKRGILKPPSYRRYSGDKKHPNENAADTSSSSNHPATESGSPESADSTSTHESGGDDSLDRIICNLHHSIVHNNNLSPQRPLKTALWGKHDSGSDGEEEQEEQEQKHTHNEERLRIARIKHIEDLNERIKAAKSRKLVERKAFRREDRLMLRLARELKTTSRSIDETEWKIKQLEQINGRLQENCNRSQEELNELRASGSTLREHLVAENDIKLANERSAHNFVLRNQSSQLEALKTGHQSRCQELCESVLDAHSELDRLRELLSEQDTRKGWFSPRTKTGNRNSSNSSSSCPSPIRKRGSLCMSPSRRRRGSMSSYGSHGSLRSLGASANTKSSVKAQWWGMLITVVVLGVLVVAATLAAFGDGNGLEGTNAASSLGVGHAVTRNTPVSTISLETSQTDLSEREMPEIAYSKILALEEKAGIADKILAVPATHTKRFPSNDQNGSDFSCADLPVNHSESHGANDGGNDVENPTIFLDATRSEAEAPTTKAKNKHRRRSHKTNQFVASVARIVFDGTTLGTIIRRE